MARDLGRGLGLGGLESFPTGREADKEVVACFEPLRDPGADGAGEESLLTRPNCLNTKQKRVEEF